jgi:ATP synthase protein I
MAKGMRATSELVGGVLVGGFIGWQLDRWLGTKPWLLILFFLLGVGAGFWNVMRGAFAPTGGAPPGDGDNKSPGAGA